MATLSKAQLEAEYAKAMAELAAYRRAAQPIAPSRPVAPVQPATTAIAFPWEGVESAGPVDDWARKVFAHVGEWNLANPTYKTRDGLVRSRLRNDGQPFLSVFVNRSISGQVRETLYERAVQFFGGEVPPTTVTRDGAKTYPFTSWLTSQVPWLEFSQRNLQFYAAQPSQNGVAVKTDTFDF